MHRLERWASQESDGADHVQPSKPPASADSFDPRITLAVARRLLQQFEHDGIDSSTFPVVMRLRRKVLCDAVESGDLVSFEAQCDELSRLFGSARAEGWIARDMRREMALAIRDEIARATADLCARGTPPRFGLVRSSLRHALRAVRTATGSGGAPSTAMDPPTVIDFLSRGAVAQCLAMGSPRRARALARTLRKHMRSCAPGTSIAAEGAVACSGALVGRWGASDREIACTAALAAAHALPWSAAVAAEAADALLSAPGASEQREARALAHAVAFRAWLRLGDPSEAAQHASACRAVPMVRVSRRWGRVLFVSELIDSARAWVRE